MAGPTQVVVVLIRNGDKLLLTYNHKWRAFTFPMTKLREWEYMDATQIGDPDKREIATEVQQNFWKDAAAHAVVECLGIPSNPQPLLDGPFEVEYSEVERSGRDGADRIYHYKIYTWEVQQANCLQQSYAWLTQDEIRSGKYRPLSPTVLRVLSDQEVNQIVSNW